MCSHRLAIAKLVHDYKEPLFSHSPVLTRQNKQDLWEYIRQQAIAQGAVQYMRKSWKEIRDCVWAPIRRDTMAKVNKARLVGEDTVVYTEIDKIVMEIVGSTGGMDESLKGEGSDFFNDENQQQNAGGSGAGIANSSGIVDGGTPGQVTPQKGGTSHDHHYHAPPVMERFCEGHTNSADPALARVLDFGSPMSSSSGGAVDDLLNFRHHSSASTNGSEESAIVDNKPALANNTGRDGGDGPAAALSEVLEMFRRNSQHSSHPHQNGGTLGGGRGTQNWTAGMDMEHEDGQQQRSQHAQQKRKAADDPSSSQHHHQFHQNQQHSSSSDTELERAIKQAKLEQIQLQNTLVQEQIVEKRLQNRILRLDILEREKKAGAKK